MILVDGRVSIRSDRVAGDVTRLPSVLLENRQFWTESRYESLTIYIMGGQVPNAHVMI